jgi:hypothetical protein
LAAVCSECGGSLADKKPGTKTCKTSCRQKRSRRLARQKKAASAAAQLPPHQLEVSQSIYPSGGRREVVDTAHRLLEQELRPVVREAITEDALRAIQKMVGLTPRIVELLEQDLESEDSTVRQRAYSLVAKYTLGHQAIVTPDSANAGQQLVVNFALPRPGDGPVSETQELEAPVDGTAEETQPCDSCAVDKPLSQFVAGSQRCAECYARLQAEVQERFGTDVE